MAGASSEVRLDRLQAELEEMGGARPGGALSIVEVLAQAGGALGGGRRSPHGRQPPEAQSRRDRPLGSPPRRLPSPRRGAPLAAVTGASLATTAGVAWLVRRARRWWATPTEPTPAPRALRRRRSLVASLPTPSPAEFPAASPAAFSAASPKAGPLAAAGERPPTTATPPGEITDVTRNFLLGVVMPIWMVAGVADWLCHRRARIQDTTGPKEALIHLLMLGEASLPVIAGMVLEITSPVLVLMAAAVALHAATALWDVSYAVKRRTVTPIEQHVHSYLEMVPVMATSFIAMLHWPEVRALLGMGDRPPDWSLRRKARPLPGWAVAALLAGTVAFELLPYMEELQRTRRRGG